MCRKYRQAAYKLQKWPRSQLPGQSPTLFCHWSIYLGLLARNITDFFVKQEYWRICPPCPCKVQQSTSLRSVCPVWTAFCVLLKQGQSGPVASLPHLKQTPRGGSSMLILFEVEWGAARGRHVTVMKSLLLKHLSMPYSVGLWGFGTASISLWYVWIVCFWPSTVWLTLKTSIAS